MKENAIAVNEYDMIGAELYYCYCYINNAKRIENKIKYLENKINSIEQKIMDYSTETILEQDIDWSQYLEIQEKYNAYCKSSISTAKNQIDDIKSKIGSIYINIVFSILFLIIPVALILVGYTLDAMKIISHGWSQVIGITGLVLLVIAILILKSCIKERKNITDLRRKSITAYSDLKEYELGSSAKNLVNLYVVKQMPVNYSISIFRKNNPDFFANLEKEKGFYQNRINEHKLTLNSIKNEFKQNMSIRNTIIPSVYHNEEDITNLIDYYVRRRGDTWKELVNEYEHDKKLNQIISSIDNLSNQVSVLTDSVIKCFNIVGMQLGIIHQSIVSLQNTTAINLDKISQIENQQEKRLCELTSSIQNMNLKTEVIIES